MSAGFDVLLIEKTVGPEAIQPRTWWIRDDIALADSGTTGKHQDGPRLDTRSGQTDVDEQSGS
jgi:hypothetical protein